VAAAVANRKQTLELREGRFYWWAVERKHHLRRPETRFLNYTPLPVENKFCHTARDEITESAANISIGLLCLFLNI
jgi:hypothetical protein